MKKNQLLTAVALMLSMGATAQVEDVTSKYITNPSFEDCTPLEVTTDDNGDKYVDLVTSYSVAGGTDYADNGWKLLQQITSSNAGVVTYDSTINVKYNAYAKFPMPEAGPTEASGSKALVFTGTPYGSNPVTYETAEVTLPAGWYRLSVSVYTYSGWAETTSLKSMLAFVSNNGQKIVSEKPIFNCNQWDGDTIVIELTEPTTGRFQLGYTASFFTVIDDVTLEYEDKVITSSLEAVIVKAKTLSAAIYDSDPDLTAAIGAAEAFVQNPTSQEAVATQVALLKAAINTALENTYEPIDVSEIFVDNYSFESGKVDPWQGPADLGVVTPSPYGARPAIDGDYYAYFNYSANEWWLEQTVAGLPTGYYYVSALASTGSSYSAATPVTLYVNDSETTFTPNTGVFTLGRTPVVYVDGGTLKLGAKAEATFSIDNFRLVYCTDEDALNQGIYDEVADAAKAVLDDEGNAIITGEERTALQAAIDAEGDDLGALISTINEAVGTFLSAKSSYQLFETAKTNAAAYTLEDYPYASPAKYDVIQTLVATVATSAADAERLSAEIGRACLEYYASNANVEGVEDAVNYTDKIVAANAQLDAEAYNELVDAGVNGTHDLDPAWTSENMTLRWQKPWTTLTQEQDTVYYGITQDYYLYGANQTAYMEQTISGLPAGKYVFSAVAMSSGYGSDPDVMINGEVVGQLVGVGTYSGGKYNSGWNDCVVEFTKETDGDMTLRLQSNFTYSYKEWYVDNLRLFKIADLTTVGIDATQNEKGEMRKETFFDLQGRRVAKPAHGLYIVGGKKVVVK